MDCHVAALLAMTKLYCAARNGEFFKRLAMTRLYCASCNDGLFKRHAMAKLYCTSRNDGYSNSPRKVFPLSSVIFTFTKLPIMLAGALNAIFSCCSV